MEGQKISKALSAAMLQKPETESLPVIVKYRREQLAVKALVKGVAPTYQYSLIPAAAMRLNREQITWLAEQASVEHLWLDMPVHALLDESVRLIQAPAVWQAGFRGQGMRIAILDTGIDPNHPDVAGRIAATATFVGNSYRDDNGHGTHVASIAAGNGAASHGLYVGVAPEASLYVAKVLAADGSGMMSDVMAGVEWAVEQRAHVIGLSLGSSGPCDGTDALSVTCDAAVERGVVVCVAAGNSGPGRYTLGSPGCARQVITVGASDDQDQVASFSSRGPTSDGRVKPDIVFPGVGIVAARAAGTAMGQVVDEHYTSASGTSMATPHAVGAVALLLQANPSLTPREVKELLMRTARNIGYEANAQGAGRGDVYQAYLGEPSPPPPEPPQPPEPGEGCFTTLLRLLRGGR
ncbi:MAG: S8 family peptidase [Anaerolineae bacterium]|jgi:serine protease AprX|nr:S8 family peptidase [Anaerolineae bacterium]